jgi:hypothetical protein
MQDKWNKVDVDARTLTPMSKHISGRLYLRHMGMHRVISYSVGAVRQEVKDASQVE